MLEDHEWVLIEKFDLVSILKLKLKAEYIISCNQLDINNRFMTISLSREALLVVKTVNL